MEGLDVQILGINPASPEDHDRYRAQLGLNFPLLSDRDGQVTARYGALNPDRSVQRSVYIVDKEGRIRFAGRGMHWTSEFYDTLASLT